MQTGSPVSETGNSTNLSLPRRRAERKPHRGRVRSVAHGSHDIPGFVHHVDLDQMPVEIRAEDSVSYVRLLKEEEWVHDLTAELADHFSSAKVVWSIDQQRLVVVVEMAQNRGNNNTVLDSSPVDIVNVEGDGEDGDEDVTRKMVRTDFHGARNDAITLPPLPGPPISQFTNGTLLPPAPNMPWQPPELAIQSMVDAPVSHNRLGAALQAVRTSMPLARPGSGAGNQGWLAVALMVAVFTVAATLMLSTPAPGRETIDTTNGVTESALGPVSQSASLSPLPQSPTPLLVMMPMPERKELSVRMGDSLYNLEAERVDLAKVEIVRDVDVASTAQTNSGADDDAGVTGKKSVRSARAVPYGRSKSGHVVSSNAVFSRERDYENESSEEPSVEELPAVRDLPDLPSRSAVKSAMSRIARRVSHCRLDERGRLILRMSFSGNSGQMTSARIMSDRFEETLSGECAVRAVTHARLPRFGQDELIVTYPFDL
ncbi:MAG: hypothetical protein JXR76_01730 [Deltaproteobacteria bacterium]|nr:hypothetical protein [Deltaproteobacteria bacterium]